MQRYDIFKFSGLCGDATEFSCTGYVLVEDPDIVFVSDTAVLIFNTLEDAKAAKQLFIDGEARDEDDEVDIPYGYDYCDVGNCTTKELIPIIITGDELFEMEE